MERAYKLAHAPPAGGCVLFVFWIPMFAPTDFRLLRRRPFRFAPAVLVLSVCAGLLGCQPQYPIPATTAEIETVGILALQARQPEALAKLTQWAQSGSALAQRELGLALSDRPETVGQAVTYLQQAARAGDALAQFTLAQALHDGKLGLAMDDAHAWKWYERSAAQGNGKASFMMARMASHGQGVAQDAKLCAQWLQKASEQGHAQAMYQLSVAYENGDGVPVDLALARYWLSLSAELDYPIAVQALAMQLDGQGGPHSAESEQARLLMKEANDHRLMGWNTHQ